MEFYLVRHAEAEGNISRQFHGGYDSVITANGLQQLSQMQDWFKGLHLDIIYSSDLRRASTTAQSISHATGAPITIEPDFREINGGDWETKPWKLLSKLFPESYNHWLNSPHLLAMPNGETMVDFQKRLINALNRVINAHPNQTICICSHGTAIKALMCYIKGLDLSEMVNETWFDNASITRVVVEDGKFNILLEGFNDYLGDLSTFKNQNWWRKGLVMNLDVMDILKKADVLMEGHWELASGRHSNKYMQCAKLFQNASYSRQLCAALAARFADKNIDVVIGPALGAVIMAYEVSRHLDVPNLFAERENGKMTLRRGFELKPGQRVLVCEDVITTGGSAKEVVDMASQMGAEIVGVACIVDRSGGGVDFGVPGLELEALVSMEITSYPPEQCPLCKENIPVVKPGSKRK